VCLTTDCLQIGRTPLLVACQEGRVEVVSVLLAAGAQTDVRDEVSEWIGEV
jgi:ankyrin repeat protein